MEALRQPCPTSLLVRLSSTWDAATAGLFPPWYGGDGPSPHLMRALPLSGSPSGGAGAGPPSHGFAPMPAVSRSMRPRSMPFSAATCWVTFLGPGGSVHRPRPSG